MEAIVATIDAVLRGEFSFAIARSCKYANRHTSWDSD